MPNRVEIDFVADTAQAAANISKLDRSMDDLGGAGKRTGLSLTDLKSGLDLATQAFRAIQSVIKAVIDPTIEYAKQVRDLSRTIGASAEESSKLIQAADDVMISYGTLTTAMEAAIRKGVEPTIEGMGKLADEYNAIQSPIARTKFLMDNFGRSGADLAPLMELGADGIRALGDEAENTGLVLSKDMVQSAREFEKSVDALQDATAGYLNLLATKAIPILTDVNNLLAEGITLTNQLEVARRKGVLTDQEAASVSEAVKYGYFEVGEAAEYVQKKTDAYNASLTDAAHENAALERALAAVFGSARKLTALNSSTAAYYRTVVEGATAAGEAQDLLNESLLAAGLAGEITKSTDAYHKVLSETTPEIERLNAEIAKYNRMQGQSVTITGEATTSSAEYELAAIRAAKAQQKVNEYTGDSREEYLALVVAADAAQERVVKLGEGFGTSETFTLNYTKKLVELNTALGEQTAKQLLAEEQLRRTTAEFVFQKLAAGLDEAALLQLARSMGLMDEASAAATQAALELKQMLLDDKIGLEEFAKEADNLARAIASLQSKHITITVENIQIERLIRRYEESGGDEHFDGGEGSYNGGTGTGGSGDSRDNRQFGGPVSRGSAYTVGEAGRELFVPEQNGFIMDNADTMRLIRALESLAAVMGRPNVTNNFNAYAGGSQVGPGTLRALAGAF